jgi:hypothetical protein
LAYKMLGMGGCLPAARLATSRLWDFHPSHRQLKRE